jgi:hypothetical protein
MIDYISLKRRDLSELEVHQKLIQLIEYESLLINKLTSDKRVLHENILNSLIDLQMMSSRSLL